MTMIKFINVKCVYISIRLIEAFQQNIQQQHRTAWFKYALTYHTDLFVN